MPTSRSRRPRAQTISVPEARSEAIRIAGAPRGATDRRAGSGIAGALAGLYGVAPRTGLHEPFSQTPLAREMQMDVRREHIAHSEALPPSLLIQHLVRGRRPPRLLSQRRQVEFMTPHRLAGLHERAVDEGAHGAIPEGQVRPFEEWPARSDARHWVGLALPLFPRPAQVH